MHINIALNRGLSGGGNIGLTNNPNVLKVSISDDEALSAFPTSYAELVEACKNRYSDFKQNQEFHAVMREVNQDPKCTYERKLDPTSGKSATKRFYNIEQTLAQLDKEYTEKNEAQIVATP